MLLVIVVIFCSQVSGLKLPPENVIQYLAVNNEVDVDTFIIPDTENLGMFNPDFLYIFSSMIYLK